MKFDIELTRNNGKKESLSDYKGNVLLIVNTASKCGFTSQYEGLEKLHKDLGDKDFEVLGFPCNQFGAQEPGDDEKIAEFCKVNYGVSFPLFTKIDVNGDNAHPLFVELKSQAKGDNEGGDIKWNFEKFLIDKKGEQVFRFTSKDTPESLKSKIQELL